MSIATTKISKRELLAYQADVKGSIFRQIRQMFARLREDGFTQKELANRIQMDPGQLSRRLRGDFDLKLETLSDLARGLDCRIDVALIPIAQAIATVASARPATIDQIYIEYPQPYPRSDGHGNDNAPQVYEVAS